jgi:hypothetical protein
MAGQLTTGMFFVGVAVVQSLFMPFDLLGPLVFVAGIFQIALDSILGR